MSTMLEQIPPPVGSDQMTLVEQLVMWARRRIDERVFRPGLRMPSIRRLASEKGVSPATVVDAYERLVSQGYLEARRGSGFYVLDRLKEQGGAAVSVASHAASRNGASGAGPAAGVASRPLAGSASVRTRSAAGTPVPPPSTIDVPWLLNNIMHNTAPERAPGLGFLPNDWLDGEMLAQAVKRIGRQNGSSLLRYGLPQGSLPLRQQLQIHLAGFEIGATPEQIVTLSGITHAVDLITRLYLQPGDSVLVGDPAWFQMFGRIVGQGARLLGVPYTANGPDLDALELLAQTWRPKLMVINSILHNPTGTSLSAAQAYRILQIAERYDFTIVEDDIYGDLCPPNHSAVRLASLDQLRRVIYAGSFSKTLAPNLRVAYIACDAAVAKRIADQKLLASMTTPELGERIIYGVLTEGHYRRHVERLRHKLESIRAPAIAALKQAGVTPLCEPEAGLFIWGNVHCDSSAMTAAAHEAGFLLAPGALFSPSQTPSTYLRLNLCSSTHPGFLAFLAAYIQRHGK
jgi:DNA-binding transcriptional MocR family regulator